MAASILYNCRAVKENLYNCKDGIDSMLEIVRLESVPREPLKIARQFTAE
jgi:hypothetical protein